jgi:hypothetical protein
MNSLGTLNRRINNEIFRISELFQSNISSKKVKILFSNKQDWEWMIRQGFEGTLHKLEFNDIHLVDINNYDLIVPLTISDLKYLDTIRPLIANNPIPIPSLESIELCDDKYLFNTKLTGCGFGDYIPKMGGTQTYPYIFKKRIDQWG